MFPDRLIPRTSINRQNTRMLCVRRQLHEHNPGTFLGYRRFFIRWRGLKLMAMFDICKTLFIGLLRKMKAVKGDTRPLCRKPAGV